MDGLNSSEKTLNAALSVVKATAYLSQSQVSNEALGDNDGASAGFTSCSNCTVGGGAGVKEFARVWGTEYVWQTHVSSSYFSVNPKLLYKSYI